MNQLEPFSILDYSTKDPNSTELREIEMEELEREGEGDRESLLGLLHACFPARNRAGPLGDMPIKTARTRREVIPQRNVKYCYSKWRKMLTSWKLRMYTPPRVKNHVEAQTLESECVKNHLSSYCVYH